jgi:hypothetical protein
MNNKDKMPISRNAEKNLTVGLTAAILLFVSVCLPVLVIGGILYWVLGG